MPCWYAWRRRRSRCCARRRPSSKLTRGEVVAIVASVLGDIDSGRPAVPAGGAEAYDLAAE